MTLFARATDANQDFCRAARQYYGGGEDRRTVALLVIDRASTEASTPDAEM